MSKLLPQQLMRGVELAFAASKGASLFEFARDHASDDVRFVPLRRTPKGRGFEPIPVPGGMFHDPWQYAARCARDVKRLANLWADADAVGVTFPHGGPDCVLDPDTGELVKFVQHVDATFR